jgi:hypothetical protein
MRIPLLHLAHLAAKRHLLPCGNCEGRERQAAGGCPVPAHQAASGPAQAHLQQPARHSGALNVTGKPQRISLGECGGCPVPAHQAASGPAPTHLQQPAGHSGAVNVIREPQKVSLGECGSCCPVSAHQACSLYIAVLYTRVSPLHAIKRNRCRSEIEIESDRPHQRDRETERQRQRDSNTTLCIATHMHCLRCPRLPAVSSRLWRENDVVRHFKNVRFSVPEPQAQHHPVPRCLPLTP